MKTSGNSFGRLHGQSGLSLIELTVIIVVIGILTAIAMQSLTVSIEAARRAQTEEKLQKLIYAITGNPDWTLDGVRTDFGYVGDNGALPPDLNALVTNPGLGTWDGPYVPRKYSEEGDAFKFDAWGAEFSYTGTGVSSSGNGTPISLSLPVSVSDLLLNKYVGRIEDITGRIPGPALADSVSVLVEVPNGSGIVISKLYRPDSTGLFALDSIPAGQRTLRIVFVPSNDTLYRTVTVLPRQRTADTLAYQFGEVYF